MQRSQMLVSASDVCRRYYEEFFSAPGRMEIAEEIFQPDVVFHNPISERGVHGIDEYKQFAQRWAKGFPDRKFVVADEVTQGDQVAIHFTITGTHQGEFMGAAPTGHTIVVNGMNLFQVKNGKIAVVHAYFNPLEITTPLGLPPPPLPSRAS
jgi:steroid delta-isomerase-like uncharacterized protein